MSLKSIAAKAGVSVSTASRALNDPEYRCSSPKIREKIWAAAREEHYVPNAAARRLKLGENGLPEQLSYINILITRTDGSQADPFFAELFRALQGELHKSLCMLQNVWHVPEFSDDRKCEGLNLTSMIDKLLRSAGKKNDGIVIIGKCAQSALKLLQKKCMNIVSINRNSTNYTVDEVLCDGRTIARDATDYLIGLGYRDIGYIGSCHHESRYKGFCDALSAANLELVPHYVVETKQTETDGFEAMETLLEENEPPTALFCANDITAIGVLKCLTLKKVRKNKRPAIVSCDDIEEARSIRPSLTTYHLDKEEMVRHALYLLLDRIKGGHKNIARIEVQSHLVERESSHPDI
jgi:sulfate transport system ATP-binding protein/LacI family transcriptional regulator/LacI family repressor for deo operon, udp, cdd, tsx, nupC, and nupG